MKCNVTRVGKRGKCRSQYLNINTTNSLLGELTVKANESVPSSPGTNGFALSPSPLCFSPTPITMAPAGATASALEKMAGEMLILKIFLGPFMLVSQRERSWPSSS